VPRNERAVESTRLVERADAFPRDALSSVEGGTCHDALVFAECVEEAVGVEEDFFGGHMFVFLHGSAETGVSVALVRREVQILLPCRAEVLKLCAQEKKRFSEKS